MTQLTILFDASGTLVTPRRTFPELLKSGGTWATLNPDVKIQQALASMGVDSLWPEDEPDPDRRLKGWFRFLESTIYRANGIPDKNRCLAAAESILDPTNYRAFPDVVTCLEDLRHDTKIKAIGLVSNFDPWLRDVLDLLDLTRYFDHLSISGETGYAKPDPQAIHHAISALGADPRQTVLVGDSMAVDGAAAHAAGIKLILIDREGSLSHPEETILSNLNQLTSMLDLK